MFVFYRFDQFQSLFAPSKMAVMDTLQPVRRVPPAQLFRLHCVESIAAYSWMALSMELLTLVICLEVRDPGLAQTRREALRKEETAEKHCRIDRVAS